jgi:hypothetical protein
MSDNFDSSKKPGCFGNFTTLAAALGGGTGIVALIVFAMTFGSGIPHDGTSPLPPTPLPSSPSSTVQPSQDRLIFSGCNSPNVMWGNVSQYFEIGNCELKPGYQQAESNFSFVVAAKGGFFGSMIVYFYDSEGVKICPNSTVGCSVLPYEGSVYFTTKQASSSSFWSTGERDRASISIPSNAAKIEFRFSQS